LGRRQAEPEPDTVARIIIVGGGIAGLAAAAALGSDPAHEVQLFETRAFLGGRATSYSAPASVSSLDGEPEIIDNCQHILLKCCVNLRDFYSRLGVADKIEFHRKFYFIEPGGRTSTLEAGLLPSPAHFTESFLKSSYLSLADKLSLARGLLALKREYKTRTDLDSITMFEWLREKRQTPRAIDRFWRQVLVSAINEDLERMAAAHGFQVFWLGFLTQRDSYEMGIPRVPLGELYDDAVWRRCPTVKILEREPVERMLFANGSVCGVRIEDGSVHEADYYISAVPFDRITELAPEAGIDVTPFSHVPITGIHLWFDRPITDLPHATLLDRTIQWMYNKREGRYIQLVISASRSLTAMPRAEVIALGLRELAEFFPAVVEAKLEKAHVVKEMRATFSAEPGLEVKRPLSATKIPNLFLAGDWTRSGWPSTMEGAVRSGYKAAEAVAAATGDKRTFLLADIA
jgi:squalene-associated FAD-dependent desaturase